MKGGNGNTSTFSYCNPISERAHICDQLFTKMRFAKYDQSIIYGAIPSISQPELAKK